MATTQAWEAFQRGSLLALPDAYPDHRAHAAAPETTEPVSAQVLQSWVRSKEIGIHPERIEMQPVDVSLDTPFARAAIPVMLGTADLLANSSACLALADAEGAIVWRWVSDSRVSKALDRAHVVERASWREREAGTNGIGTALETGEVATIVGASHYVRAFHEWACVAAPVFHPLTRAICGVVNITCRAIDANQFLQVAIRSLVANVTSELHAAASVGQKRLLEAYLAHRERTRRPLLAIDDTIVITDEMAVDHDVVWSRVLEAGADARSVTLPGDLSARLHPVSPGTLRDGVVLEIGTARATLCESSATSFLSPLESAEREVIARELTRCAGNKSRAAEALRISRRSLYDKLHRYGLRARR